METDGLPDAGQCTIFGEIQVLLAEKRTALASLRTGIAVFALPLLSAERVNRHFALLHHGEQ